MSSQKDIKLPAGSTFPYAPGRHLLVIDDDKLFCDAIRHADLDDQFTVHIANTANSGLALCSQQKMDVVLLDQQLPDKNGTEICPSILSQNDKTKIILATAYPDLNNAVEVIKLGAFDYLAKPFNIDELCFAINRAFTSAELEQVAEVSNWKQKKESAKIHFIGSSRAASAIRNAAHSTAKSRAPVLLTGATGTGKTLLAKYIHSRSPLQDKVFLSVNCAILQENLIEAELFGAEKGAFTDATSSRRGIFELASGGTLFLDEIGTLPYHLQAKLLGVLDDGMIKRLGSEKSLKVDVRILTATNTNLITAIKEGTFREDLFYRLSVLNIELPTLLQRKEDLRELCSYFLNREQANSLTEQDYAAMAAYSWPGNVRELKNVLERAVLLGEGGKICLQKVLDTAAPCTETKEDAFPPSSTAEITPLKTMEQKYISQALEAHNYNRSQTARSLDISRSTLIRKMKLYNLDQ